MAYKSLLRNPHVPNRVRLINSMTRLMDTVINQCVQANASIQRYRCVYVRALHGLGPVLVILRRSHLVLALTPFLPYNWYLLYLAQS
jgi:hypothetical protein